MASASEAASRCNVVLTMLRSCSEVNSGNPVEIIMVSRLKIRFDLRLIVRNACSQRPLKCSKLFADPSSLKSSRMT